MKNLRKTIATMVIVMMLSSIVSVFMNHVEANGTSTEYMPYVTKTKYYFNSKDVLVWAAGEGAGDVDNIDPNNKDWPAIPTTIDEKDVESAKVIIAKNQGVRNGTNAKYETLAADDAVELMWAEEINKNDAFKIAESVAKRLGVSNGDVSTVYTIKLPAISSANIQASEIAYTLKNGKLYDAKTNNELTEEKRNKYLEQIKTYYEEVYKSGVRAEYDEDFELPENAEEMSEEEIVDEFWEYHTAIGEESERGKTKVDSIMMVSATVVVGGDSEYKGAEYKLILGGNDKYTNVWALERTKEPDAPEEPTPVEKKPDFATTLTYTSTPEGKMNSTKDTYLPPYYDNDNNKKDVDATAKIKSKTEEEIVATNGVKLTDDGKANSEGWYYPDTKDKTVIAKDYKFDDYDNTTANGKVKETVKLTGSEGGEDSQTPSVEWTFRRKTTEEKENSDGSVTVTITYNLPVDPADIPDGWSPVYDADGKTIHKIQKTIKKGEDYEKDVTVKQNGTNATNTTHVKKIWEKLPAIIPQTGENLVMVVAGAIVLIGVAVISYRKFKK